MDPITDTLIRQIRQAHNVQAALFELYDNLPTGTDPLLISRVGQAYESAAKTTKLIQAAEKVHNGE